MIQIKAVMKVALITGITGQDGAYLTKLLLKKNYKVIGCIKSTDFWRLDYLGVTNKIQFEYLNLKDFTSLDSIISKYRPDEFYNLAGISSVFESFNNPLEVFEVNAAAVAKILEIIRLKSPHTKFYQASSSEMFGNTIEVPQVETTSFHPVSPYAVSKTFGHHLTISYREGYNLFACSGILFNHESVLRGSQFVTSKIIKAVKMIAEGGKEPLIIGNLEAKRDWGYAEEYVLGMWKMLQLNHAEDFILATGVQYSVRQFIEMAFQSVDLEIYWEGNELKEIARLKSTDVMVVRVAESLFRPLDANSTRGNPSKAKTKLMWEAKTKLPDLIKYLLKK